MAEIIKTSIDVDINTSGAAAELRRLQQQINAFNLTLNKNQKMQGQAAKVWSESLANAVNRTGMFRAEVVKMQTSAAALDSTLRKGQATLGQFFSAAFNKRSAMAAETFALAAERARTMQTQFIATGKSAKGMQDALAIRPLTAFSSELSIASQRTQILSSMFRQGTTQLINFGKNVQWAGRQLMVGFTVPLTIFGTTAGRVFRDLEMQAVSFKKVYGDIFTTPAEIQGNLEAVMQLGKEYTKYGIAVKDTVGLAAQAAAAGRRGAELTDAVRETTRLATLGQMDQNSALETTIALQSAFRLSGQQLTDTINFLNMVENQTVVSLQDIASAIPRVAPVIQGLGGDVKDLTVFLAAMQEGGVSAEQGANALKSGLGSLINPSKEATKQLGDFGINIKAIVQQNQGDLMGIVTAFSQALATLGEFQQQQVLETLFGKYQYARLGALFENIIRDGSQAQQVISTMGYTTQQLAQTAEKELSTVEQAFSVQLIAAVERLKLAIAPIGELFTKMAIPIVNFLTKIVEAFNRLPEGTKNFVALATVITGLLIPAATMMFGLFANLIGTLAKMGQSMSMFGVTLLKRGPVAAIKSLTDSSKYLSLSEIDAANAARQLGSATSIANQALLQQVGTAADASVAINNLTAAYERLIAQQIAASRTAQPFFGPGAVAANIAKGKGIRKNKGGIIPGFNSGNIVPGTGNSDTVPAMLTPGEFVVNKQATKNNLGLLSAINAQKFGDGGQVGGRLLYSGMKELTEAQHQKNAEILAELLGSTKADNIDFRSFIQKLEKDNFIKFAGQDKKDVTAKISYQQLEKLFNDYTEGGKNVAKVDQLINMVAERAKTNRTEKNALKSEHLKQIVKKLGLGDERTYFRGIGKVHAAHTTSPSIVSSNSLFGVQFAKTGVPIQELGSRVIALQASLNSQLQGGGVRGIELLDEVNKKGGKLFTFMDAQFDKYIDMNRSTPGFDIDKVRSDYTTAKTNVFNSLVKQLSNAPDSLITDSGKPGSISFESIFDNAMKSFATPELDSFHKDIKKISYIRAPRVKDLRMWAKSNPIMKAFLISKGMSVDSIDSMNAEKLWSSIFEANGYADSDPTIKSLSKKLFKTSLAGEKILINPTHSKPGVVNPLGYKHVEKYLKIIFSRGIKKNKGGMIPGFNIGNIVPGTGNTDKVPAMLTPGEFVVNKEATKNNMGLLHAINSQKLNKGGKVKGMQYFVDGGVAQQVADYKAKNPGATTSQAVKALGIQIGGTTKGGAFKALLPQVLGAGSMFAFYQPLNDAGTKLAGTMGGLAASLIGTTAISGLLQMGLKRMMGTPVKLAEQFSLTTKVLTKISPVFQRIGIAGTGWIGATIGLGVATYKVISTMNEIRNSGARLTEAMYGGINSVNNMAVAFGRQTPTQQLASLKAQAVGGAIGQQAQQQANQFIGTDAGKQLLADIQLAKKNGEDAATALRNQLARNILAGVITPEEARGVAVEVGNALNDQKLAVDVSARLTKLIGPNGEEIKNNRVKIIAEIAPELNSMALIKQATEQYTQGTQSFWGRIGSFFDNKSVEITNNAIKNLATSVSNYALIQKQSMDDLELQMIQGTISIEEYNKQVGLLDKNARDFNSRSLKSFFEISGVKDVEKFNKLLKETQKIESRAGTGTVVVPTEAAVAARKQVENQVKSMQDAYFAQIPNITEEQKNATISGMKAAFGGTESTDIILGWAQLLGGYISAETVKGLASGAAAAGGAMNKAGLDALKRKKATSQTVAGAGAGGNGLFGGGDGEDPLQRIKDQIKETDALLGSTQKLISAGLRPEIAATLNAAEAKAILADKSGNLIKKLNDEADKTKILSYIYKDPKQMGIEMYSKQIEFIDRGINAIERQISVIKRKNELDQRSIDVRNRALEQLSKQEKSVNDQYDMRVQALDKVAKVNDRIAQQTQDRIALAGALTGGDFAAAAQAAAGMTANFASNQIEDARAALELQRKQEIEALTVSVNGQLLTRQQIQNEIDTIEERMYQRDQQVILLQDQIYLKEEEKYLLQQEVQTLNDQIALQTAQQTVEMSKQVGVAESLRKKLLAQYEIAKAIATRNWGAKFTTENTGGEIKKAFGGVMYRGSKEAPPALRMATGSIVPGMGITDKVPALLTPGEFVVRKSVAQANMPLLKSLNGNVFPNIGSFGMPETSVSTPNNVVSNISSPVYNYSVNVNVPNTTSSPNEIADVVINKIRMTQGREIRGNRY